MARRPSHVALDVWPVIADAFLAIIAIVVVLASGRKPEDREVSLLKKEMVSRSKSDFASLLDDIEVGENWIRLIFTDQSLSFTSCRWDLPNGKQEDIRRLFRWIGERPELLRQIRIEGHSDNRWEGLGCPDIGPFLDNLQLSQNRARAVYNVLLGLSPTNRTGLTLVLTRSRLDTAGSDGLAYIQKLAVAGELLVAGYGDRRPRDRGVASSPKNRRVEVVLEFREQAPNRRDTGILPSAAAELGSPRSASHPKTEQP